MVLQYATSEDEPFSNVGVQGVNPDMWPLCLSGRAVRGEFTGVSTAARAMGIVVGTRYVLQFAPHNDTYALMFGTATGDRSVYGHYTWSLAELWRDSLSGGQDSRQSALDLGVIWGENVNGMCLAFNKNVVSFTSQLVVASFDVQ